MLGAFLALSIYLLFLFGFFAFNYMQKTAATDSTTAIEKLGEAIIS